jgi:DNA-binding IclR family transcriptional regulator
MNRLFHGMKPQVGVQSVKRAMAVLVSLTDGPKSLAEVAIASSLPKATAYRLLASLTPQGFVVKDPATGIYMLGPGLLRLAQGVTKGGALIPSLAKPGLIRLWDRTKETITLHVRAGRVRICVEEVTSPHPIRYSATVGGSSPLHAGSAGKLLLAMLDSGQQARLLRSLVLDPITEHTITDRDTLVRELRTIRHHGWAYSSGEGVVGVNALSVPVRTPSTFLALSIVGPAARLTRSRLMRYLPDLEQAAQLIEEALSVAYD